MEQPETPYITSTFSPFPILRLPVGSHTCQTKEERVLWSTFCSGKEAAGHEKSPSSDELKNWQIKYLPVSWQQPYQICLLECQAKQSG